MILSYILTTLESVYKIMIKNEGKDKDYLVPGAPSISKKKKCSGMIHRVYQELNTSLELVFNCSTIGIEFNVITKLRLLLNIIQLKTFI